MFTRPVRRVMQLDGWINTAWLSSCRQICIEHWQLLLWVVWHHSLEFCSYISSLILLLLSHLTLISKQKLSWLLSCNLICILQLSHGVFDPCTCTDKLPCRTIWSLTSRYSWHVTKLMYKLLLNKTGSQKCKFSYLFLCWCRSYHHVFVRIQYLYGD